ncbi:MAG: restriction endonuclease subunit S [Chloroflexi bacterium]|nr:MAG: restriction endonuclease subunit S [Chloroflexota bacterium]
MSKNWKRVPIENVYVALYDGPHATPKPSSEGPVFLGIKNVTEDGKLDLSEIRHIAEEDFPQWTRRVVPKPGDIVFTYEATLNRYAIIPRGFRGCLGRRLALIRPHPEKINPTFLFYYFFGEDWRTTIAQNILSGSTVDRIPLISFPSFEISVPPLPTQHKISAILSAYDDLIENNTRRIAILEEMAQAIYQEWFVRFRYPGHEQDELVESELGMVPEGWKVVRFTQGVEIDPYTKVSKENEKPFVPMESLSNNSMVIESSEYRLGNSGSKFKNGDTLFARITPCIENGKTGYVQFLSTEDDVALGSTEFIVLRSKTLCPEFVYLIARSDELRNHAIKSMSGSSGRQRVQKVCFDSFWIVHPNSESLMQFREIVTPLFRSIHMLVKSNKNLCYTRDLLLPKLISGEIDVASLNIDIPNMPEPAQQQDTPMATQPAPIDAEQLALPLF